MNRRNFLKGMLGGAVASVLPASLLAETKGPFEGMNISDELVRVHEPSRYRESIDNDLAAMVDDFYGVWKGDIITIGNNPKKYMVA